MAHNIEPYYRGTFKSIIDTSTYGDTDTTKILRSYAAGVAPAGYETIGTFRDYARNNPNNKMSIGDWRDFDFLCLYLIKYADYNSQAKVGDGITNGSLSSVQNNGFGSAHTTLQGRDGYIGTSDKTSVWCLGLCDFWGKAHEFVDGITINDLTACVATDPDNYTDLATPSTPGYTEIGYSNLDSNGYPKSTGYDSSNQLIAFPTKSGGSASTGLCDIYYENTGVLVVRRGGDFNYTTDAGAFFFTCANGFANASEGLGCRLLKTA